VLFGVCSGAQLRGLEVEAPAELKAVAIKYNCSTIKSDISKALKELEGVHIMPKLAPIQANCSAQEAGIVATFKSKKSGYASARDSAMAKTAAFVSGHKRNFTQTFNATRAMKQAATKAREEAAAAAKAAAIPLKKAKAHATDAANNAADDKEVAESSLKEVVSQKKKSESALAEAKGEVKDAKDAEAERIYSKANEAATASLKTMQSKCDAAYDEVAKAIDGSYEVVAGMSSIIQKICETCIPDRCLVTTGADAAKQAADTAAALTENSFLELSLSSNHAHKKSCGTLYKRAQTWRADLQGRMLLHAQAAKEEAAPMSLLEVGSMVQGPAGSQHMDGLKAGLAARLAAAQEEKNRCHSDIQKAYKEGDDVARAARDSALADSQAEYDTAMKAESARWAPNVTEAKLAAQAAVDALFQATGALANATTAHENAVEARVAAIEAFNASKKETGAWIIRESIHLLNRTAKLEDMARAENEFTDAEYTKAVVLAEKDRDTQLRMLKTNCEELQREYMVDLNLIARFRATVHDTVIKTTTAKPKKLGLCDKSLSHDVCCDSSDLAECMACRAKAKTLRDFCTADIAHCKLLLCDQCNPQCPTAPAATTTTAAPKVVKAGGCKEEAAAKTAAKAAHGAYKTMKNTLAEENKKLADTSARCASNEFDCEKEKTEEDRAECTKDKAACLKNVKDLEKLTGDLKVKLTEKSEDKLKANAERTNGLLTTCCEGNPGVEGCSA
jgi:hypothetical protein